MDTVDTAAAPPIATLPADWLDRYDVVLFDCDGVLWRGGELIDGAREVVELLKRRGKAVRFVTNNSTSSRRQYQTKMERLGLPTRPVELYPSSYAAALYVHGRGHKRVYVVGEEGLCEELQELGIEVVGGPEHRDGRAVHEMAHVELDAGVTAVVMGFDTHFSYRKMAWAKLYVDHGCEFVATNGDLTFPSPGHILPGGGAFLAAVEACTGKKATVVGKPSSLLMEVIERTLSEHDPAVTWTPERVLMIGDRLDTDVLFGRRCGAGALLVESGVHSRADAERVEADGDRPHFVAASVKDMVDQAGAE